MFEDIHLHEKPRLEKILNTLNFLFAVIFSIEFFLKVIGFGFVKYFTSVWNCLDALIVSVTILCLCLCTSVMRYFSFLLGFICQANENNLFSHQRLSLKSVSGFCCVSIWESKSFSIPLVQNNTCTATSQSHLPFGRNEGKIEQGHNDLFIDGKW